ncbi:addiction module toxin RelE [Chelonobacter oris]|uniref:type II toxin-antitoxin system RelE family toxin n=1 Tax=Chelonobacter oris TaxID=505317 RepID=UPI002446CF99|nr:type II toxin-antitoxin system RelE/ParE family toxin [Chelonobacter oris]MDH3001323.1 addiction module toxin RelE [Chelonobacter oris]
MSYNLEFDPRALKEWKKLGKTVQQQFKKKLKNVLEYPEIPANKLHGFPSCFKIKLKESGYRLVYQVQNEKITVLVIAIGKRERSKVYLQAIERIK